MGSNQQNDDGPFQIVLVASILLAVIVISFIWFFSSYHFARAEAIAPAVVATGLVASAGLLMSILLSMTNLARWARILFDTGAVAFLIYLFLVAIGVLDHEMRYPL